MTRRIFTIVFTVALSLIVSPALAQDWDDIPQPEIIVPETVPLPEKPPKGDKKPPKGNNTRVPTPKGDDNPSSDACGGRGEVDDVDNPGKKRCKTLDEWWNEKVNPVKEQAKEEAEKEVMSLGVGTMLVLSTIFLIISILLRRKNRKENEEMKKALAKTYKLAKRNDKRLNLGGAPYPDEAPAPAEAATGE